MPVLLGFQFIISALLRVCSSSAQPTSSASSSDSLFAKFAAPSGSWECGSCMLQNKPEATKCVACETAKPGAKPKGGGISKLLQNTWLDCVDVSCPLQCRHLEEELTTLGLNFGKKDVSLCFIVSLKRISVFL